MKDSYIYILKLKNNKWYVGYTQDPEHRIHRHFQGSGCQWTKIHPPITVEHLIKTDKIMEDHYTLLYAALYDNENVRGGKWAQPELSERRWKRYNAATPVFD